MSSEQSTQSQHKPPLVITSMMLHLVQGSRRQLVRCYEWNILGAYYDPDFYDVFIPLSE